MSKQFDVVVLTDRRYINPKEIDVYTQNVLNEDNYVVKALQAEGLKATRLAWDDSNFDWKNTKYAIFRTTWDYFERFEEFSTWLNKVSKETRLLNSEATIRWNIDKHYLLDLQREGVHICESYFVEKDTKTSLKSLVQQHNLEEFVLKPCVSGGAYNTFKINPNTLEEHEAIFQKLIANEAMIVQPFQHNIVEKGEISLMLMNGIFTHAVLKIAKPGDFRVQDDFGGAVHDYSPSQEEINFAQKAVQACKELPMYARVDIFTDNNGKLAIAELELIEPELWFRRCPESATKLAKAIKENGDF